MLTKAKQFLVHRIAHIDRGFRDLAVNPVQTVLIRHMMGDGAPFSSFNCFVKWAGEFGMGPNWDFTRIRVEFQFSLPRRSTPMPPGI